MKKKRLFKSSNKKKTNLFFILLISIFICMFILFYLFFKEEDYFIIPSYNDPFYLIPKDKEGQKITNQDKKGLHLTYKSSKDKIFVNDPILEYSIQLLSHENYDFIVRERDSYLSKNDTIFLANDIYVAILKNNLGNEYLLLYKNFPNRSKANEHCDKYANFLEKCIIVNVKNLD